MLFHNFSFFYFNYFCINIKKYVMHKYVIVFIILLKKQNKRKLIYYKKIQHLCYCVIIKFIINCFKVFIIN